jgi:hypothetical protein
MGGFEALLLLAGVAWLYTSTVTKAAGNLIFVPGNIINIGLEGMYPVVVANLLVQNTSNVDFTLNSFAATVTSDGTLIGNVSNFNAVAIPGNSQTAVPLNLTLFPLGIVDNLIQAFYGGFVKKEFIIDGSVNANGQQVPLKLIFKVG